MGNFFYFLRVIWAFLGDIRASMRKKCPRFYLCCCLCMNRGELRKEKEKDKAQKTDQRLIVEMDSVIESKGGNEIRNSKGEECLR